MIQPFTIKNVDLINPLCAQTSFVITCELIFFPPITRPSSEKRCNLKMTSCPEAQLKYGLPQNI